MKKAELNTKLQCQGLTLTSRGSGTIELLIALAVLVITLTAVTTISFGNQSVSLDSRTNNEALEKAKEEMEKARLLAKVDFNLLNPKPATPDDIYNKSLEVNSVDLFTKKITSLVGWSGDHNRPLYIKFTTLVTNPDALDGGDTCSSVLEGDWTHPRITSYEYGRDILGDISSGFPVTSVQAFNKKLYVTVNNDHGNNPGTFHILDISDPSTQPILLSPSTFDNAPVGAGLNAVAVDGKGYAYVANAYTGSSPNCMQANNCSQLQVINVQTPSTPLMTAYLKISAVTVSNRLAAGWSVSYKDRYVYIGLDKVSPSSPRGEFNIVDVSNPLDPQLRGHYFVGNRVNTIVIKGNYAYLASPNSKNLIVLDVSNPDKPTLLGDYSPSDAPESNGLGSNHGKSLNLIGSRIYLGRTYGDKEFRILNVTDPSNITQLAEKDIGSTNKMSINGLIIRDFLAFFVTDEQFQIWNISNPTSVTSYATPLILPPGSGNISGRASDCEGNYIFVGSQGSNDKGYISVITAN